MGSYGAMDKMLKSNDDNSFGSMNTKAKQKTREIAKDTVNTVKSGAKAYVDMNVKAGKDMLDTVKSVGSTVSGAVGGLTKGMALKQKTNNKPSKTMQELKRMELQKLPKRGNNGQKINHDYAKMYREKSTLDKIKKLNKTRDRGQGIKSAMSNKRGNNGQRINPDYEKMYSNNK